ncbi:cation:proton antiporter [bacterium]|nr:cation:proton antiporter [bacterium]
MIVLIASLVLILVGLYAIITKRNLIKVVVGFALTEYAVNLLFAIVGFRPGALPPILTGMSMLERTKHTFADPIPQALVLTAIVIGLGTTALMLSMALRIYQRTGTFDLDEIKKLKG